VEESVGDQNLRVMLRVEARKTQEATLASWSTVLGKRLVGDLMIESLGMNVDGIPADDFGFGSERFEVGHEGDREVTEELRC